MSPIAAPNTVNQPPTAASAFRLEDFALAAIAAQLAPATPSQPQPPELTFLCDRLAALTQHHPTWHAAYHHALSNPPHPADAPLSQLSYTFSLTPIEQLTIALAAAVEENVHIGRAVKLASTKFSQ